jgi:iron complex transport system substrate-binding protein
MIQNICRAFIGALILSAAGICPAAARQITDMAGRQVETPDTVNRVYGTSPPATYTVYALDPGLLAGLYSPLNPPASSPALPCGSDGRNPAVL